jgi:hypothetical protein
VSGRSDLPWDEAVRLDLNYVENWWLIQDLVILWRTSVARHWCVLRIRLTRSIIAFFSLREVVLWDVRLAQAA